jgi:hypothetical protein
VAQGWHWVGYLPATEQALPCSLDSLGGRFDLLVGETGTYAPPPAPQFLNTLWTVAPGEGYQIRMTQAGTLVYGPDPPPCPAATLTAGGGGVQGSRIGTTITPTSAGASGAATAAASPARTAIPPPTSAPTEPPTPTPDGTPTPLGAPTGVRKAVATSSPAPPSR